MNENKLVIVTHNGEIHINEVASIALLTNYFASKYKDIEVYRAKSPLATANILIDIGGEYNHELLKYDHHRQIFSEYWNNSEIPLTSIGLIWRHYGTEILKMYLTELNHYYDDEIIEILKDNIYFNLFQEMDANDNGIPFKNNDLLNIIDAINRENYDDNTQNENFERLVTLVVNFLDIKFKETINFYFNFEKDLQIVKTLDLTNDYVIINEKIVTIFECLKQIENNVKFVIFYNWDKYIIKTINKEKFVPLVPLEYPTLHSGIVLSDILFHHKNRCLAEVKTLETAKAFIQYSMDEEKKRRLAGAFKSEVKVSQLIKPIKENRLTRINRKNNNYLSIAIVSTVLVVGLGLYYFWSE